VTAKQPVVKTYIVKLSADERERLNVLIQKSRSPARQLLKARVLLKADASEAGNAWSDGQMPRRWIPASTPSPAHVSNWWRADLMPS
jgi:hypothetical protein